MGFTGGNNAGIRFALNQNDCDFLWLLNNDTVVEKNTLSEMLAVAKSGKKIGITGSKLMDYDTPQKIQALGGNINTSFGQTHHLLSEKALDKLNYIIGASFLISKECLERIGFLDENFFLYNEDCDYCLTAQSHGFKISVALASVVYHKEGGSSANLFRDYYGIRNTVYLGQKHFNPLFTTLYAISRIIKRMFLFRWKAARIGIKAVIDCWAGRMGRIY